MRNFLKFLLTGLIFALPSCTGDKGGEYSSEVVLSSELLGSLTYYVNGFSFETGEFIPYPGSSGLPDLVVENYRNNEGEYIAAAFSSPGNNSAFLLKGEFNSSEAAKSAYEALLVADTVSYYMETSDTLRINQVWLFKSESGHYARMLINDIEKIYGTGGVAYFEITLTYRYQPEDSSDLAD